METEGVKEASERRLQIEDNASSTRPRKFLQCGKNITQNMNHAGKNSLNVKSERTQLRTAQPEETRLTSLVERVGGVGEETVICWN